MMLVFLSKRTIISFHSMIFANKKIILVFFIITCSSFAQDSLETQFNFAKSLYDSENYFDAVTEAKRLLFFDAEAKYYFDANLLIGLSYKAGAKLNEAIRYFTLAEINSKNDDQFYQAKILSARTNILRRSNEQAERILNSLLANPSYENNHKEIKYWLGWNFMFADQWQKAYETFSENNLDTALANICQSVVNDSYNENFAKYSSYLIPGFGQFYTGEYISGLLSLGWNVLFGYLTINSFIEERVFDGIIIANFLWLRFYSGNTQNAEKFAKEKNIKIINTALDQLQFNFKGIRP